MRGERERWVGAGVGLEEEEGWGRSASESESESTSIIDCPAFVFAVLALGGSSAPGGRLSNIAASKFKYSVLSDSLSLARSTVGKNV